MREFNEGIFGKNEGAKSTGVEININGSANSTRPQEDLSLRLLVGGLVDNGRLWGLVGRLEVVLATLRGWEPCDEEVEKEGLPVPDILTNAKHGLDDRHMAIDRLGLLVDELERRIGVQEIDAPKSPNVNCNHQR